MKNQLEMQIGKQGVTSNFIQTLENAFKNHAIVRISLLKASGRDKDSVIKIAEEIRTKLSGTYGYRIIGFKIIMRKSSKSHVAKVYKPKN